MVRLLVALEEKVDVDMAKVSHVVLEINDAQLKKLAAAIEAAQQKGNMNDFICPKCNQPGLPSIYLPMCTACANIERRKSGEIKDDNAAQHSMEPTE